MLEVARTSSREKVVVVVVVVVLLLLLLLHYPEPCAATPPTHGGGEGGGTVISDLETIYLHPVAMSDFSHVVVALVAHCNIKCELKAKQKKMKP